MNDNSDNNKDAKESKNDWIVKDSIDNKQIESDEELNKNNYDNFNSNNNNIPLLERIEKKFNAEVRGIIAKIIKKITHNKNFINFKDNIKQRKMITTNQ